MKTDHALVTSWVGFVRSRLTAKQPLLIALPTMLEVTLWKIVVGYLLFVDKLALHWDFVAASDLAIVVESAPGVPQVEFTAGVYSPWERFLFLLGVAQIQSPDSLFSFASSIKQMLAEMEEKTALLEWGEITKGLRTLAASTGNPIFADIARRCDVELGGIVAKAAGDALPPNLIFVVPPELLEFAEQSQPVEIGIADWHKVEDAGPNAVVESNYGGQSCRHEIVPGEQSMHDLRLATVVRRTRCEVVPVCWCHPTLKSGTTAWFIHYGPETESQNPTPPEPTGEAISRSVAEAGLRATGDGDLGRLDAALRRIPKIGGWRQFTVEEIVIAGRIVLDPLGDAEPADWGKFAHAQSVLQFLIDTVIRQWRMPAAPLLKALADAGLLQMAVYCAGYAQDPSEIRKAVKIARHKRHFKTAVALTRLLRPVSA